MQDLHGSALDELEKAMGEADKLLAISNAFIALISDLRSELEALESSEVKQHTSPESPLQA